MNLINHNIKQMNRVEEVDEKPLVILDTIIILSIQSVKYINSWSDMARVII